MEVAEGDVYTERWYSAVLRSEPTGTVTVTVASDNPDVSVTRPTFTFTTSNWDVPRRVVVRAAEDDDDISEQATLSHTFAGGGYGSVTGSVTVNVHDTDTFLRVRPGRLSVRRGETAEYEAEMVGPPTTWDSIQVVAQSVTYSPSSSGGLEGQLLFLTPANWNQTHTMSVYARDDARLGENVVGHEAYAGGLSGWLWRAWSITVTVLPAPPTAPLMATFDEAPASHDGSSPFTVRLEFSEVADTQEGALRRALQVSGGSQEGRPERSYVPNRWTITLRPAGNDAVTLTLLPTTGECDEANAMCTADGRKLAEGAVLTVPFAAPPMLSRATVDGSKFVLAYDKALDSASVPAVDDFVVTAAASTLGVNGVSVSSDEEATRPAFEQASTVGVDSVGVSVNGSSVVLTLAAAVEADQAVTVSYTPGTNPIQDVAGNAAARLSNQPANNTTPPPSPSDSNNPPTASDGTVTATENQEYTFTVSDFDYADTDGDPLASVTAVTLLASGTGALKLAGQDVSTGDSVTSAQLDAGSFEYSPPANVNGAGYASFTFTVNDGTDDSASAYTLTIDIDPAPSAVPGPPENLSAVAADGAVELTWQAPSSNGGSAIVRYERRHAEGATVPSATAWQSVGLTLSHTVPGLTNGQLYTFQVRAVNGSSPGEGPAAEVTATPTDKTPPVLDGATVNGVTLVLTYNEALDATSVPEVDDFVVTADGNGVGVDRASVSGSTVTLTLVARLQALQTVRLSYTPGADPIQDAAGNHAASLSGENVTNETQTPVPALPVAVTWLLAGLLSPCSARGAYGWRAARLDGETRDLVRLPRFRGRINAFGFTS